jgi:alkanesulfonate monooxygenase SsuD/methylene tetrahydromethanopterin reductase-like flavin-dependent oxidoreductase (luciferase family)
MPDTSSTPLPVAERLGVTLVCGPSDAVDVAVAAEAAGLGSVWTTEFSYRSALVPLAAIAAATSRLRLGTAIAYALGRSPTVLAAEARDVDELSAGRLVLGLGSAQPARIRDWLGVETDDIPGHVAEMIQVLRALWHLDDHPVHFDGRHVRVLVRPDGRIPPPVRREIPVLLAAVNRRMMTIAGSVADGVIAHPIMNQAACEGYLRPVLQEAADRAGRAEAPVVAAMSIVVVDDDHDVARRHAASQIAFYLQHSTYEPLIRWYGFAEPARRIRAAVAAGDWQAATGAVSEDMIDSLAVAGPPHHVREHIATRLRTDTSHHLILHTPSMLLLRPVAAEEAAEDYRSRVLRLIDAFATPAPVRST